MVVDGIGLSGEDCADGISSDYIDRDNDPCSSPQDDEDEDGGGDDDGSDDDEDDGGGDDDDTTTPPDDEAMNELIADIRLALSNSFSAQENLYGDLATSLNNDLFASFIADQEQQMAREEQARVTLRAAMLNIIPFSTQESFFNQWLTEQIEAGMLNPIDEEAIQSTLPTPIPPNITARIEAVRGDLRGHLVTYAGRGGFVPPLAIPDNPDATPSEVLQYLFDHSLDLETREAYLISLIEDPNDIIDASQGDRIYHDYIDLNNVITTYNARFYIIDDRDPRYTGPQ